MKHKLFLLFLLWHLGLLSQDKVFPKFKLDSTEVVLNTKTKSYIFSNTFSFEDQIDSTLYDSVENKLYVWLNELDIYGDKTASKYIFKIDLKERKIIWSKKYNSTEESYYFVDNFLIYEQYKKIFRVNKNDGAIEWELPGFLEKIIPEKNLGIAVYYGPLGFKNSIFGIDLSNGKILWKNTDFKTFRNPSFQSMLQDSIYIMCRTSLYGININTGEFWEDETSNVTYCHTYLYKGFTMSCSNFLWDSTGIYIDRKKSFDKLDNSGKVQWSTPHPNEIKSGLSFLSKKDNSYILISIGYVIFMNDIYYKDYPFLTKYSLDGKEIAKIVFDKKNILNYTMDKDTMILIFKKHVEKVNLNNFELFFSKEINKKELRQWEYFLKDLHFIRKIDETFRPIIDLDSTYYYIYNTDQSISQYDKGFNLVENYKINDYSDSLYKDSLYTFINNNHKNSTYVLDSTNNVMYELNHVYSITNLGNRYLFQGKKELFFLNKDIFYRKRED